jgi:signal transduction histidine kinase
MRLAAFILQETDAILRQWVTFAAAQLPAAAAMDPLALRDHAEQILKAIAEDIESYQSREAQATKSLGAKPVARGAPETAAQTHAVLRARSGFDINQLAAEYRALRASVLRAWTDACPTAGAADFEQVMRFNEAIDEALAESINFFSVQIDQARNLLLGTLAHDMRSPLQSIQMTATYLGALNAGDEVSEAAARITNGGCRMKALLDDLLDFNRIKLGVGINVRPAPIDLAQVLEDEVQLLRAAYPARRIELDVSGDTRGAWDGMRLRQVLGNLVVNAITYGDEDAAVHIGVAGDAGQLRLEVTNRGPVIERAALQTIFDPLRRNLARGARCDSSSLGLGLYIAREIVAAHEGDIDARSDETRTVFEVRLPRQPQSIACHPR